MMTRIKDAAITTDFRCLACGAWVTGAAWRSGVQNRNHCPYCLWSRHLDLQVAGDRLAACKERMQPFGLALKRRTKKYPGRTPAGELMLAHRCLGCGKTAINRVAADDDAERLLATFEASLALPLDVLEALAAQDVRLLRRADAAIVHLRLYG